MQSITQYANEQLWEKEWQKEDKHGPNQDMLFQKIRDFNFA